MESGKLIRKRSFRAVILALVTVLALLVAPVCGPLCAARACESGTQAQGVASHKCHGMSMAKDQDPQWHGHLLNACGRGELPAANFRPSASASKAEYRLASTTNRGASVDVAVVNAAEQSGGPPASHSGGFEKLGESCVRFSVLRI